MLQRIAKTLLIGAMLIGLAYARPSVCVGWSLNPFASSDKTQTKTVRTSATKTSPSTWEKATAGTKNFFNKTGEKLGLKKPQPKPAPAIAFAQPRTLQPKTKDSKWSSWFKPEKSKPKDVSDWLGSSAQITP